MLRRAACPPALPQDSFAHLGATYTSPARVGRPGTVGCVSGVVRILGDWPQRSAHYLWTVAVLRRSSVLPKRTEQTWAIYRLAAKAIYLGQVTAPDEDKAVKAAIKQLPVTNPAEAIRKEGRVMLRVFSLVIFVGLASVSNAEERYTCFVRPPYAVINEDTLTSEKTRPPEPKVSTPPERREPPKELVIELRIDNDTGYLRRGGSEFELGCEVLQKEESIFCTYRRDGYVRLHLPSGKVATHGDIIGGFTGTCRR
jgi:hypothetical protein